MIDRGAGAGRSSHALATGAHVAIIMDGNGRWASAHGLPRTMGYRAGVQALRRTAEAAPELGVTQLTVFGFSTENWRRPAGEVSELMSLLKAYLNSDLERLACGGVRVKVLGQREGLSSDIRDAISYAELRTAYNDRFRLQVAFNYGGQADLLDAARAFAQEVKSGLAKPADLNSEVFETYLSTADVGPADLIIRTSGEQRLSNFLLWEAAYAELVFQDVLWPDYGREHLKAALDEFDRRQRRFGGLSIDALVNAD